ncbi:MAG: aldehyde dehydrogenase family protein [Phycisphaerae bacterium]|nr:aldehyde dehydrogenase family protein [Phycisphaerae bacterium]
MNRAIERALRQVRGTSIVAGSGSAPGARAPRFRSHSPWNPQRALPIEFVAATARDVSDAAGAADRAFRADALADGAKRGALLRTIAEELEARRPDVLTLGVRETGLSRKRLGGEFDRMVGQARMFAAEAEDGSWVRAVIDPAAPGGPDVRRMLIPLGPAAVFGASNFPLAYGVMGGDSASALASGCPVVAKNHPAHPATGELIGRACAAAVVRVGLPEGVFQLLHSGGATDLDVGRWLVEDPRIRAVGFTGSRAGGEALAALGAARRNGHAEPDPIPVFAEMGSANPVVVTERAAAARGEAIAAELAKSILGSTGQMCTCPGLIFVPGAAARGFFDRLSARLRAPRRARAMLTPRIAAHYHDRLAALRRSGCAEASTPEATGSAAARGAPALVRVRGADVLGRAEAWDEVFGPAAVVVECDDAAPLSRLRGALVGSVYFEPEDETDPAFVALVRALAAKTGRLVCNGVPTGVRVCRAMVHGGPYPATNVPWTSAVGASAMERWCRPLCWQAAPPTLLPPELRPDNPLGIERTVNGNASRGGA